MAHIPTSCEYTLCDNAFTLSDTPITCDYCGKQHCFNHRDAEYHECPALLPKEIVQRFTKPQARAKPEPEPVIEEYSNEESTINEEPLFTIDPYTAKIGLLLVTLIIIILTKYLLF
jgi:hypothetical protein